MTAYIVEVEETVVKEYLIDMVGSEEEAREAFYLGKGTEVNDEIHSAEIINVWED